ncbi:MAG: hypothetical protein QOI11_2397 [Candidatus Eremiobacteraeota bacterium]|nr:hypothetical protein [Candidatus Eremiobacteraeota bacterium]
MAGMRTLVTLCAAAAFAAAAAPPSAADPGPLATPAPVSALPEIGRTKAVRPVCTVLRDLIEPSVHAAQRGDRRFNETLPVLQKYVKLVAENNPVGRGMTLMAIERGELALAQEQLAIAKALGDPRVAEDATDPDARALRASLLAIEEAQAIQRNFLHRFAHRERLDYILGDLGGTRGSNTVAEGRVRNGPAAASGDARPDSPFVHPEDVPLSGNGDHDQRTVETYMRIVANARVQRENAASPAIARTVESCR